MTTITVPAVAAALLTVPRDCETCGNERMVPGMVMMGGQGAGWGRVRCPDCRNVCEWLAVDEAKQVGSTIHIEAGPLPEQRERQWSYDNDPTDHLGTEFGRYRVVPSAHGLVLRPIDFGPPILMSRPGVVVATGVVTECVPIIGPDDDRPTGRHIAPVYLGDGDRWYLSDQHLCEVNDITEQRLDQDWSPTRPCPHDCERFGGKVPGHVRGSSWAWVPCWCDGAGTLPRYAIRLTNIEAT